MYSTKICILTTRTLIYYLYIYGKVRYTILNENRKIKNQGFGVNSFLTSIS